jgi:1,3-beta-glucanosyltransferase GAS5
VGHRRRWPAHQLPPTFLQQNKTKVESQHFKIVFYSSKIAPVLKKGKQQRSSYTSTKHPNPSIKYHSETMDLGSPCPHFIRISANVLMSILLMSVLLLSSPVDAQDAIQECANFAPPAVMKGNKIFVSTTGEYLPIKGVSYYPRPNAGDLTLGNSQDFYSEDHRASWERDIAQFAALGVNSIRLYAVDPGLNHDAFMCALKAVGIYVLLELVADCENCAIQWQDSPNCYPAALKERGQFVIQRFSRYENVLGFSAGNEVALGAASHLGNLPCQKKFIRDMRAYVNQCTSTGDMRHIPIGVVIADSERAIQAQYFNCRTKSDDDLENAEFIGINVYLHCDGTVTDVNALVGYQELLADFASYGMTVPVLWTEFGCLNESFETIGEYQAQRNFLQVEALFSPSYRDVFNGGYVFEYSTEKVYSEQQSPFPFTSFGAGNYGVGYFSPENCDGLDIPCEYIPFPQFQTLASRYAAVDASTASEVALSTYNPPTMDPPACPPEIPSLSAFMWATDDGVDFLQCPILVPTYCSGIPGECTTVPPPVDEAGPQATSSLSTAPTFAPTTETPTSESTSVHISTPNTDLGLTGGDLDSVQGVSQEFQNGTAASESLSNAPSMGPTAILELLEWSENEDSADSSSPLLWRRHFEGFGAMLAIAMPVLLF